MDIKLDSKKFTKILKEQLKKEHEYKENLLRSYNSKRLEKVLKICLDDGSITDDDILYQDLGIKMNEFNDCFNYITLKYFPGFPYDDKYNFTSKSWDSFPDFRAFFEYDDVKYIIRLLIGQGSCRQIFSEKSFTKKWPSRPLIWKQKNSVIVKF